MATTENLDIDALFDLYGSDKTKNGYAPTYHALFKNLRYKKDLQLLEIGIGTMIKGAHSSMVGYALPNYAPGGSLRAWRDYFLYGEITGLDVQPDTQFTNEARITTYLCNSTDANAVKTTFKGTWLSPRTPGLEPSPTTTPTPKDPPTTNTPTKSEYSHKQGVQGGGVRPPLFEIIIDDGSHWDQHQLDTLRNLYPFVKPGGYYIIEDVTPNSRIPTSFLPEIKLNCPDALISMNDKKNLMIISRRGHAVP